MPFEKSKVSKLSETGASVPPLVGFEYCHQFSRTTGDEISAAELAEGELALNSADGTLFYKNANGGVSRVSGGISDAAVNGITYGRKDGQWSPLTHASVSNSPATLPSFSADQNNLDLGSGGIVRISSSSVISITGFLATFDGDVRLLCNTGTQSISLRNEHSGSSPANRIAGIGGADVTMPPGASFSVWYDAVAARWRAS